MSLTAAPVSALSLESSVMELWREFLTGWFDGATHALGPLQTGILFPKVDSLKFQQSAITRPLDGRSITLTMANPASTVRRTDNVIVGGVNKVEDVLESRITFSFWVRAGGKFGGANDQSNDAEYECRAVADMLYALLSNSAAVLPLGEKGIRTLRPRTPQLVSSGPGAVGGDACNDFHMRLLSCMATLRYPVLSRP